MTSPLLFLVWLSHSVYRHVAYALISLLRLFATSYIVYCASLYLGVLALTNLFFEFDSLLLMLMKLGYTNCLFFYMLKLC
jgi:hypothetical protein